MEDHSPRIYRSLLEPIRDLWGLVSTGGQVGRLMRGDSLDPAFRERLMLAVTAVNDCRYCSYAHARQALAVGVSSEEVEALAAGQFEGCPPDELRALLYAQHWAETDGHADPEARTQLAEIYGSERAKAIELALRVIRMGNLGGNTFDQLLHRLSLGRLGRIFHLRASR